MNQSDIALMRTTTGGKKSKTVVMVAVKAVAQDKDFQTFVVVHKAKDEAEAKQFIKTVYPNLK